MLLYEFLKKEYEAINLKFDLEKLRNKTFLITGANGLIGSNILNYLYFLNKSKNLNMNFIGHSFSEPVSWLPQDKNTKYIASNLADNIPDIKFDYLIHTATYGQPKMFMSNKMDTVKLNVEAYIKLLELAKKNNASVLYTSSSEIYGQVPAEITSIDEMYFGNVNTLSERAIYAESKRLAETISYVFGQEGMLIHLVRLSICYGPGVKYNDTRVYSEFIKKALNDKKIDIMDRGLAGRNYIFITDGIEMMLNIMFAGKEIVYNVSSDHNVKIFDIADTIGKKLNIPVNLPKQESSVFNAPSSLLLSSSRYCNEFNKNRFIDIDDGLNATIKWFEVLQNKK